MCRVYVITGKARWFSFFGMITCGFESVARHLFSNGWTVVTEGWNSLLKFSRKMPIGKTGGSRFSPVRGEWMNVASISAAGLSQPPLRG